MALLSVWGILLVLLGHSGFEEPIIQQKLSYLHSWIYSFHMPLFFLISGFLFSLTNPVMEKACTGKFIWKKTLRLIVPYVVLGTVIFAIKYVFAGLSHADRVFSVGNFFKMFIIPGAEYSTIGHLWYVFTLYMIFLLVLGLICIRLLSADKVKLCLLVLGIWVVSYFLPPIKVFHLSSVLYYAPYFLLGILLQRNEEKLKAVYSATNWGGQKCIIYLALTIGCIFLPLHGLYVNVIRAIIGILFSLSLCDLIIQHLPRLEEWMMKFSNKTYTIYLLSWFGHYIAKVALVNVLHMHYLVVVAGMFIGGLLFPLVVCWLVDRLPWLNKKGLRIIIGY